jgi:hypothetical protein
MICLWFESRWVRFILQREEWILPNKKTTYISWNFEFSYMKKIYWILIIVAMTILAFFLTTNIVNPLDKSCNSDSDCVLAYTGLGPCAPCDQSDNEMQCVSLKEAEELQNRRDLIGSRALCSTCLTPQILYRCVCGQNGCEKTTSCSVDSDCKIKFYACIDNQCKQVVT